MANKGICVRCVWTKVVSFHNCNRSKLKNAEIHVPCGVYSVAMVHFVNGSSFYVYVKLYCVKPLKSLASDTRLTLTFTTVPFRHIIKTIHLPLLDDAEIVCVNVEKFLHHQCQFVEFVQFKIIFFFSKNEFKTKTLLSYDLCFRQKISFVWGHWAFHEKSTKIRFCFRISKLNLIWFLGLGKVYAMIYMTKLKWEQRRIETTGKKKSKTEKQNCQNNICEFLNVVCVFMFRFELKAIGSIGWIDKFSHLSAELKCKQKCKSHLKINYSM